MRLSKITITNTKTIGKIELEKNDYIELTVFKYISFTIDEALFSGCVFKNCRQNNNGHIEPLSVYDYTGNIPTNISPIINECTFENCIFPSKGIYMAFCSVI